MLTPHHELYLQQYLATLPSDAPQRMAPVEASRFGDNPALADELGGLIVAGVKTATCSALWSYERTGEPLPVVGLLTIVLDSSDQPLCVIETTEVEIRPFHAVDERFAYAEGEDDRTLASWRREHWRYFQRTLSTEDGPHPSETMPLICERFRLVYR